MGRSDSAWLGISRRDLLKVAAALPVVASGNAFALRAGAMWRYSAKPSPAHRAAFEAMFGELIGPFAPADVPRLSWATAGRTWFVAAGAATIVLSDTDEAGRVIERIEFRRA